MANSGSFNTSAYSNRYVTFSWSVASQSVANNYTDINWSLKGGGSASGYYKAGNFTVVIDGETVYNTSQNTRIELYNGTTVASGTKRIYHGSNGAKSFSASVSAGIYTFAKNVSGSGSWDLPTIPRYASITKFDLAKRNETSVKFTWEASKACDAVQYSVNNGSWVGGAYPTTTISGLSPNTSYSIKIRVKATDSQLWTESTAKSITTNKAPANSFNSKTETTVKINWSCDDTVDYIWYSKDNGANWTGLDVDDGTSGNYTISGLSANTSYNIKTRIRRKTPQTTYDCATVSVTTYDYPYCTSSPNFKIGDLLTLSFYNPLGRTFTFYIIANGTQITNNWTISGTSYSGVNADSSQNQLYATIPNSTNATYKVKCIYGSVTKTRDNGNTYSIKGTEVPTFNNFTYKDTNSVVTGITGNDQVLVKELSTLQATISSANKMVANKSATGKNYVLSIANLSKTVNYSTSDLNIDLGKVTSSGTQRLNIRAYDSRNNSALAYKDITVYDYAKPVINASIKRLNDFEAQTTVKVSGTYTKLTINGANKNTITTVKYRYRETGGTWSSWTTLTTTVNNGTFTCSDVILSLDNTKSFEFQIQATDKLQQTTTENGSLDIGEAIFFISTNKKACYIYGEQVATLKAVYPIGAIYISSVATNPNTLFGFGAWEQIEGKFLIGCSNNYEVGTTGGTATHYHTQGNTGASSGNTGASSGSTGASSGDTGSTTLTIDQIPSHNHNLKYSGFDAQGKSGGTTVPKVNETSSTHSSYSAGGGKGHTHSLNNHTHSLNNHTHSLNNHTHTNPNTASASNLPPYLAVYIWKRTA